MMNKLIISAALLTAVSFSQAQVSAFVTKNQGKDGSQKEWRTGFAFDLYSHGNLRLSPAIATSVESNRPFYVGGLLSYDLYKKNGFRVGPAVSWTTNLSDIDRPNRGTWGLGVFASYSF